MCEVSNNQATKQSVWKLLTQAKSRKQREKRKREHTKFVYLVRSNTDLVWRREQLSASL